MKNYVLILLSVFALFVGCEKTKVTPEPPVEPPVGSYVVPIVFHVLYDDASQVNQYINRGRINEIVTIGNKFFKDNGVNLTVRLADVTPAGKTMDEAGVNRVKVNESTIDPNLFMSSNNASNTAMLWNTDEYVNVFVYHFTEENVAGISHIPYTTERNKLKGLSVVNSNISHSNLGYPHSMCLNNTYIYTQSDENTYKSGDVTVTFIHELSHYLGVMHVFSEKDIYNASGDYLYTDNDVCEDSDYCSDTDTYNKVEYDAWIGKYIADKSASGESPLLVDLVKRQNCAGVQFTSSNVMDYDYSYMSKLTPQQIVRIHHVLDYSPLIPRQSVDKRGATKSVDGTMDLPLRAII